MGADQAQIDKILSGASTESPEVRLETIEKELDFMKTSIKRLLIDIRERMNELDNPFTSAAPYSRSQFQPTASSQASRDEETFEGNQGAEDAVAAGGASQTRSGTDVGAPALPAGPGMQSAEPAPGVHGLPANTPGKPAEKLKLQKVHRLFEWVHKGCRTYGHERLTSMVDAYRAMGYIGQDVSEQIREITRMAPAANDGTQEIGPSEFVSELYVLNRILDPADVSLDRDMIEVLMLKHRQSGDHNDTKASSHERDAGDKWLDLLDRI